MRVLLIASLLLSIVAGCLLAIAFLLPRAEQINAVNNAILSDVKEREQARLAAEKTMFEAQTVSNVVKLANIQAEAQTNTLRQAKTQAHIAAAIQAIPFWQSFKKLSATGLILSICSGLLILALSLGITAYRRGAVFNAQINGDMIPVHERQLESMTPILTNLSIARIEGSVSGRQQEALTMCREMLSDVVSMTTAIAGRRGMFSAGNKAGIPEVQQMMLPAASSVPAFRQILGGLSAGDEMILGYDATTTQPVTGTFAKVHSCGIFGLSGSGKTTGLYSIICQSLITFPGIQYFVIDPHHNRPEGLTAGLPKTNHFTHLDPNDFRQGLYLYNQQLSRRLESQNDYSQQPLVLLIDELSTVMKSSQGASVEAILGRIATEGRKVGCFCLLAGHDTRLKASGNNRDLLCSQIAYNLKKKQAHYLFDDAETVQLHKVVRESKEKGLCVFAATDAEPIVIRQPYCKREDVKFVENYILQQGNGSPITVNVDNGVDGVETPETTGVDIDSSDAHSQGILDAIAHCQQQHGWSLGELSRRSGVDKGLLSKVLNGKQKPSQTVIESLRTLLTTEQPGVKPIAKVIPITRKKI